MSIINFNRQLQETTESYSASISVGNIVSTPTDFYVPITIDNFVSETILVPAVSSTAGSNILTSAGTEPFKNIRVGDRVIGLAATPLPNESFAEVALTQGSAVFVYPTTFDSNTLPLKSGDEVSSTSLPAQTKVDRIDYVNKLVYLTAAATDTAVEALTISYPVRVIAKNSTNTEISVSGSPTATTSTSLSFAGGATEALVGVVKLSPKATPSSSNVSIIVSAYKNPGEKVEATRSGTVQSPQQFNYSNLGNITFNADEFLVDARVPRTSNSGS